MNQPHENTPSMQHLRTRRAVFTLGGRGLAAGLLAVLGGGRARADKERRRRWLLGSADLASRVEYDDALTIKLNGKVLFEGQSGNDFGAEMPTLRFRARKGDRLQITAAAVRGNCHGLTEIYLHRKGGGKARMLNDRVPATCPNVAVGRFFHETFTI